VASSFFIILFTSEEMGIVPIADLLFAGNQTEMNKKKKCL